MKVLVAFGTRPEAIKLAPVVGELRRRKDAHVHVATTAQHRELLDQVLRIFEIEPDTDLAIMQPRQTLAGLTARVVTEMDRLLLAVAPDVVVVQGDTTSAFVSGLAAFYRGIPVAHVEAGLRTDNPMNPFPEEMNRRLTSALTSLHFAPTERAGRALLAEGVDPGAIIVTGNTVVDALYYVRRSEQFRRARVPVALDHGQRLVLVTLHRRESWGAPLAGMCRALRGMVEQHADLRLVLPVHLNPAVREVVHAELDGVPRIDLVEPLDYLSFIALLDASWIVLTDSGGVQEEAPALGKPVLVLRDTTERPEAVAEGVAQLVGTDPAAIREAVSLLLRDPARHARMARAVSPYGDGHAAERIADAILAGRASFTSARPAIAIPESPGA